MKKYRWWRKLLAAVLFCVLAVTSCAGTALAEETEPPADAEEAVIGEESVNSDYKEEKKESKTTDPVPLTDDDVKAAKELAAKIPSPLAAENVRSKTFDGDPHTYLNIFLIV